MQMQMREVESIKTLFWKTFECELCKTAFPYLFKTTHQKVYRLVDIEMPNEATDSHLVMESLALERNSSRTIHVLSFSPENDQFTMGRGHESQVRVNDISVSRTHAVIKYRESGVYL